MTFLSRIAPLAVAVAATLMLTSSAFAQPGGGRGFGGRGGGGGGLGGLLRSTEVQDEIELVDEQKEELQSINADVRDQMRSLFEGMRDLSADERREKMQDMRGEMEEIRASVEGQIKDVLLPHQYDRLQQVNLQQNIRRRGFSGALRGDMAEKLGITEEQLEKMTTRAQELQVEMQEKIAQLRKDSQDELRQMLTPEQRSKLEEMVGTSFDMPERGFGGFVVVA